MEHVLLTLSNSSFAERKEQEKPVQRLKAVLNLVAEDELYFVDLVAEVKDYM